MPSSRVLQPSGDDLRARREELLRRARMSREELQAGAEAGTLDADEFWLWEDIRAVEFLLDDDADR